MGNSESLQHAIVSILQIFDGRAPDPESHLRVMAVAADSKKWDEAHGLFYEVRDRSFKHENDAKRMSQYYFEELCLKTLYNQVEPSDFNPDSPFWVIPSAIDFARNLGIPSYVVTDVFLPPS